MCLGAVAAGAGETVAPPPDPAASALEKLKSEDAMMRRQGAEALGRLRRAEFIATLLPVLADPHPFVRAAAVNALGLLRGPVSPRFAELLDPKKEPDASVRQAAATNLAFLGDPTAGAALILALKDAQPGVRYAAARSLGALRVAQAVPALAEALKDPDSGLRRTAAGALGQLPSSASVPVLQSALAAEKDQEVRAELVRSLGLTGDPGAADTLDAGLKDPDPGMRLQAAQALARLGRSDGMPAVLEILKSPQTDLRRRAASVLAVIGDDKQALPALKAALESESDPAARGALQDSVAQVKARFGIVDQPPPTAVTPVSPKPSALTPPASQSSKSVPVAKPSPLVPKKPKAPKPKTPPAKAAPR